MSYSHQNDQHGKTHLVNFSDFKNRLSRALYAVKIKMSKSRDGLGQFHDEPMSFDIDLGNFMISQC